MSMVFTGKISALVFFLIVSAVIIYYTILGERGRHYELKRTLAAIDAIPDAIGRALEMGRPVHYTPGQEEITGGRGTQTQMGIVIGGYVTRVAAKLGAEIIWSVVAEYLPISIEIVREAYIIEGHPEMLPDVRYYGALNIGAIETLAAENVAVSIMFGGFGSEFLQISEAASRLGIFQINGCSNPPIVPLVVASSDYCLMGEENFAAGAILSENAAQLGGIVALDIVKVGLGCLIVLGAVMMSVGVTTLVDILMI
jgi:hypothetical protein